MIGLVIAAALAQAAPAPPLSKDLRRLIAMTPEMFAAKTTIKDDPLEALAVFSTRPGWREVPSDVYLRAFVNKATGQATYQLYATVAKRGDWPFYSTINYNTAEGLQQGTLQRVDSDVTCSGARYSTGCTVSEDVVYEIPEPLIRALAAMYRPGGLETWQFKLKGRLINGDYLNGIALAETAGLLQVVDRYRAGLKQP